VYESKLQVYNSFWLAIVSYDNNILTVIHVRVKRVNKYTIYNVLYNLLESCFCFFFSSNLSNFKVDPSTLTPSLKRKERKEIHEISTFDWETEKTIKRNC